LKLKPNRHTLSGRLRELNISTTQLLIQGNLNNNNESISAQKHITEHKINTREAKMTQTNIEQDKIEHIKRKIVERVLKYLALKIAENRVALNTT